MSGFTGEVHPLAAEFPMIGADELADLAQSIADHGQYDPITLTPDGVLLDGRNRLAACALAGVEPKFETFDGDPVPFIVGKNATRRNLSAGQRAMAVARGMWERGLWDHGAGRWGQSTAGVVADATTQVSRIDLARCGAIQAHSLNLARDVLAGTAALRATYDAVLTAQAEQDEQHRRTEILREHRPSLLRLVADDSDAMTLESAWAAYEKETEEEREKERQRREASARETQAFSRAVDQLAGLGEFPNALQSFLAGYDPADTLNGKHVTPSQIQHAIDGLTAVHSKWKAKP